MAKYIELKNTPIKEIVFALSFEENLNSDVISSFKETLLEEFQYKEVGPSYTFDVSDENSVKPSGFLFKNDKNNKIINLKRGRISFHKLECYESFESLCNEFIKFCQILEKKSGKEIKAANCSLRYLNLIELEKGEKEDGLFNFQIKFYDTFSEYKDVSKFFRLKIPNNIKNNSEGTITFALMIREDENKNKIGEGVMLDIQTIIDDEVFKSIEECKKDFKILRDFKNDLFFKSVTEKTIAKYL